MLLVDVWRAMACTSELANAVAAGGGADGMPSQTASHPTLANLAAPSTCVAHLSASRYEGSAGSSTSSPACGSYT